MGPGLNNNIGLMQPEDREDEVRPGTLMECCLKAITKEVPTQPHLVALIPERNLDLFFTLLPTDIDYTITAPVIGDGIYWERCARARWPHEEFVLRDHGNSWKRMTLEKYLAEVLENEEPGYEDMDELEKLAVVAAPFVRRLEIKKLCPPRDRDEDVVIKPNEDIEEYLDETDVNYMPAEPDLVPERLNLKRLVSKLKDLEEFVVCFGMENTQTSPMFFYAKISTGDIKGLGEGLLSCNYLKTVIFHRNDMDEEKLEAFVLSATEMTFLEVLEFSACHLDDDCMWIVTTHLLKPEGSLKVLRLHENNFGLDSALRLAKKLGSNPTPNLISLDMSLNPLTDLGGAYIASALLENTYLEELYLAGTGLEDRSGTDLGNMLRFNKVLRILDLSGNKFGRRTVQTLLSGLEENSVMERIELRGCGLEPETLSDIKEITWENMEKKRTTGPSRTLYPPDIEYDLFHDERHSSTISVTERGSFVSENGIWEIVKNPELDI